MEIPDPCMELALEGERLCKAGDCRAGVQFFEEAVQIGTSDLKTLSAIYSQLGNAYFYLQEYTKALEFHKHDLNLTRTIGDRLGEAKASGNLGNTLKVLGKFDEAIACCSRHLDISRELCDQVGEARALYTLGNVYHAKGKHSGRCGQQEPGEFPPQVVDGLRQAAEYYELNLVLVRELRDRAAEGRTCGNLGNTYYLLGNFTRAITLHEERLSIAKEYGDKGAERRAYSNLGNAHIFLGEFETAAEYYKLTLQIAKQLGDRALEAQACYSLGNTYTLLRDYEKAIEYHLRHLKIAQELRDRVGEGRACWSLGNAHTALGNPTEALQYAKKHLEISKETGDEAGMLTAQMNLTDMKNVLGIANDSNFFDVSTISIDSNGQTVDKSDVGIGRKLNRTRRLSMENMELMKLTPDKLVEQSLHVGGAGSKQKSKLQKSASLGQSKTSTMSLPMDTTITHSPPTQNNNDEGSMDEDAFFDLLSRFQSRRIDDQRCSFQVTQNGATNNHTSAKRNILTSPGGAALLDMVAGVQASRLEDQRASPLFPGLNSNAAVQEYILENRSRNEPDDDFFDKLMKCQASRMEEQRSSPPTLPVAPTVPDDDFFSLILKVQSSRLEEQRTHLPTSKPRSTPSGKKKK